MLNCIPYKLIWVWTRNWNKGSWKLGEIEWFGEIMEFDFRRVNYGTWNVKWMMEMNCDIIGMRIE